MDSMQEYLTLTLGSSLPFYWPEWEVFDDGTLSEDIPRVISRVNQANRAHFRSIVDELRACFVLLGEPVPNAIERLLDIAFSDFD
jgi:hypothetical protein